MNIQWIPPEPRRGLPGEWDKFIGPGATRGENLLTLFTALLAGLALPLYAIFAGLGWTTIQLIVAGLIATDLAGGVVANAAGPAKAWYHRSGQGFRSHLGFTAVHVIEILPVALLFRGMDWVYLAGVYGYMLLAAVVALLVPLHLQRPVVLLLYAGALLLGSYVFPPVVGMEWFVPILFLKLLVGHLLKEAPFRPAEARR